jgi:hypothetical protein
MLLPKLSLMYKYSVNKASTMVSVIDPLPIWIWPCRVMSVGSLHKKNKKRAHCIMDGYDRVVCLHYSVCTCVHNLTHIHYTHTCTYVHTYIYIRFPIHINNKNIIYTVHHTFGTYMYSRHRYSCTVVIGSIQNRSVLQKYVHIHVHDQWWCTWCIYRNKFLYLTCEFG